MAKPIEIKATMAGAKELQDEVMRLAREYPQAMGRALYQQGMQVWAEAVRRAPVEFGVLRSSGYTAPPTQQGDNTLVEVGFGTHYAVYQHEKKLNHPRGGEDHYLKNAVDAMVSLDKIAAWTRKNVEQGKGTVALPEGTARRPPARPPPDAEAGSRRVARAAARKKRRAEARKKRRRSRGKKGRGG